jgi:hypothetical protein
MSKKSIWEVFGSDLHKQTMPVPSWFLRGLSSLTAKQTGLAGSTATKPA